MVSAAVEQLAWPGEVAGVGDLTTAARSAKRRMGAPNVRVWGTNGLVMLSLSFVDPDLEQTLRLPLGPTEFRMSPDHASGHSASSDA